jgi:uncharacterized protein
MPSHHVIEHTWIPLADGTRLAARIWMPDGADASPVPAILEYLPYRKRDGTCVRDESTYPTFAANGYAGVRVDIRGTGDSDGLFTDEYSPSELADAVEVIAWIAKQPWCTGAVGMMGISWGGFNSLQVAALRPPALKAVISLSTTVDRFNDDIHYKGGALLSANLSWSSYMLAYNGRSADPTLVGEGWRAQWLKRLNHIEPGLLTWLRHQARDEYWKHGSICEDYSAIQVPALVIGGWGDGYKNAPPTAVANLKGIVKAINGPWIHKYPHIAWPHPRVDFLAEAVRWWDRWLKGIPNGAEDLPAYRAYITEDIRPSHERRRDAGRWVAEAEWPNATARTLLLYPSSDGTLPSAVGQPSRTSISSPQDCGAMGGEYFTLSPVGDLPADQRADDAGSLVFTTGPLSAAVEILGRPELSLSVAINAPNGSLAVRLMDVHPDGASQRVSFGILDLAHRNGNAKPVAVVPGKADIVRIQLDECGHRFLPGHRIRIAISTAYWPLILPTPHRITATIGLGRDTVLSLPTRTGGDSHAMPEPSNPNPLPQYRQLTPEANRRWVEHDLAAGLTRYRVINDGGETEIAAADGLIISELRDETYTIRPDDPLSAISECRWTIWRRRGDWSIRTETVTRLTMDDQHFHIEARLEAFEGDARVCERTWADRIERQLM